MANTREWRITPLAWYTLWEYKLYFVNLGKWYAKIFLRKGKMTKTPYLTFEADSKIDLLKKIDDHCLKTFGKIFRYKKLANQEPTQKKEEIKVHHVMPRTVFPSSVSRDNVCDYIEVLHNLKIIRTLNTLWVMLSALAVTMIMLLNIMK